MSGTIFVISSASGAGKTSLLKRAFREFPSLVFSVSVTTRKPRPNETPGKDYHFCSRQEFRTLIEENRLAEWQEVHGNYYGTPIDPIRATVARGSNIVLDIDVYGKVIFDRVFPQNRGILVLPPSLQALEDRLRGRATDSDQVIRLRLDNAAHEIQFAREKGRYEHTVINDDFETALAELIGIFRKEGHW